MDQLGLVLPHIINALTNAPVKNGNISMSKLDIKGGFWRMVCETGQKFNFAYLLRGLPINPIKIVVTLTLQMG